MAYACICHFFIVILYPILIIPISVTLETIMHYGKYTQCTRNGSDHH